MPSRFIVFLWILCVAPSPGRSQPEENPFTVLTERERALQLSYPNPDTGLVRSLVSRGGNLVEQEPDSALKVLDTALMISRQAGYGRGAGMALYYIGVAYGSKAMYRESIRAHRQMLFYAAREPRLKSRRADVYNHMAVQYMYLGDFYRSITYLAYAALLVENGESTMPMSHIYNNIPIVLRLIDPGAETEQRTWYYLDLAERAARKEQNYPGLASTLNSKGIYYGQQKNWPKSLEALQEALETGRKHHLPSSQASALNNMATVYLQNGSPQEALKYLKEAQAIQGNVFMHHRIRTLHITGQAYYVTGDYETAEAMLLQALHQARLSHFVVILPDLYMTLSEVYTARKQYREALSYYRKYIADRDSIRSRETAAGIHQLEVRYRTSEKDKELIRKDLHIALQRNRLKEKNIWIISTAAGALLLATLLLGAYRNNRNRQRLQAEKIRNLEQQQEIVLLKAMMKGEEKERARIARELHDGIVGQLSAVKLSFSAVRRQHELEDTQVFEEALQQLDETTGELRKTAHNLMPEILLQAGLTEAIHIYCNKMSKGAPPLISFHTSGDVPRMDPEFELTVYRITQELIQNAVKHGQASHVMVQLDYQDGLMGLTVEDDGSGFDYENLEQGGGIGLQNLRSRVKIMNGRLSVTSAPGEGTSIYLEFDTENQMP